MKARKLASWQSWRWSEYIRSMARICRELALMADDPRYCRAQKCIRLAAELSGAEQRHVEAAERLIIASRLSRKAAAA